VVIFVARVSAIRAVVVAIAVRSRAVAMAMSGFTYVGFLAFFIDVGLQLFLCGNESAACGWLELYM